MTDRAERAELLEEVIDNLARDLIPSLNRIADKQPQPSVPSSCEVYRCYRKATHTAWVLYFGTELDVEPRQDERAICQTHALEYARKHKAGKLEVAGRPVIRYAHKQGLHQ